MTFKIIFSGQLEFGTERSFERMVELFAHRAENYYRNVLLIKSEDIFKQETCTLEIPRLIIAAATEKEWKNTINILEFVVDYAIAGGMSAWMINDGQVVKYRHLEPNSDKAAIQAFLHGRELVKESGREEEAKKALSRAIEKFERHAKAYERRGFVNYQLRNYKDAAYDYSKSIDINPLAAEPYLGRALVKMAQEDYRAATADLEQAIKGSIPLQPMHWQARRIKAECHLKLEEYEKAAQELKFVTRRGFSADDPNFKWRKRALYNYGRSLLETGKFTEAVAAFDEAMKITDSPIDIPDAEQLLYRGLALMKAGKTGFKKDWQEAASQGSKKAAELLQEAA
ncbi:MAG: tetratricopeptide repeat protein [Phaeodactylibacter sp.]|nr:tetratricopeptide repeat protein [Phaeodactylibacter sp.]MCB9275082.1 tetratricopeptide repeat protein [Lewinellaceae bacterium]